ncbi:hypothetical protein TEA_025813 [Camellia sinensis var. sinensis]|uniref:Dirigent protein n=1 Tax=Camellia sinensis var. sinensis TaxID=542762 RepID=A0A4S4E4M4_CAMSN|nr:hypothetical protein TEA_025813 [Camellia sinensis var. sinensis]
MGMKNLSIMFLILAIAVMVFYNPSPIAFGPKQVLQKLCENPQFHFYFHDKISGKSPSAMRGAQSDITDKSPTFFVMLNAMDDPLTSWPTQIQRLWAGPKGFTSRQMSTVGGSGVFQLARGSAKAKTHWLDTTTVDAIVEYDVMAIHY